MKKKQRFYLMIESDKEIEPKEILFALREARPNWGDMSASLAARQSVHAVACHCTPEEAHKPRREQGDFCSHCGGTRR